MMFVYRGPATFYEDAPGMLVYQLAGWIQFTIVAFLLYPSCFLQVWRRLNYIQLCVLGILYLSIILQFHGDSAAIATGVLYTIIFVCTALVVPVIWTLTPEAIHALAGGSAIILVLFQITSVAILGWPQDRFVGGIHPNLLGATILAAFILAQFNKSQLMTGIKVISFLLAAAISSRYSLLGCVIAAFVYHATFYRLSLKTGLILVISACILVFLAREFSSVLMIFDEERGIGSGFSGRDSLWASALDLIANNPLGIGYKRVDPMQSGHNGFLRLIVEFGVVGGVILIGAVLALTISAIVNAYSLSRVDPLLRRFASARAAGLMAFSFAGFFQPELFNLGDVMGISIILFLFGPDTNSRFWNRITVRRAASRWIRTYVSQHSGQAASVDREIYK
jgi:hypothetical protein